MKWITENLAVKSNSVLENVFSLATYIDFSSEELIVKSGEVLSGHFGEVTKLACLAYLLEQRSGIDLLLYINLNNSAIEHTTLRIVKFQAYINLFAVRSGLAGKSIIGVLKEEKHPTLFYRLLNQKDLLQPVFEEIRSDLAGVVTNQMFSEEVKKELIVKINQKGE